MSFDGVCEVMVLCHSDGVSLEAVFSVSHTASVSLLCRLCVRCVARPCVVFECHVGVDHVMGVSRGV